MSQPRPKIFGMDLGIDPKVIILILIVLAGVVYYFTSGSDTPGGSSSGTPAVAATPLPAKPAATPVLSGRAAAARRAKALRNDHGPLKLIAVDGSRGDVDPTLRLGLLERLKNVPPADGVRNLFEVGPAEVSGMPALLANAPKMMPQPKPSATADAAPPPPPPPFVIPLKYYGFVKPTGRALDGSRGLFMDGDNILVGAEGDVLEKRFLIVALTSTSARLEDTQAKQGQELTVTPEAPSTQ